MTDYLLITGMSGAGRSTAAAALEDAGWYVIDNMPPALISEVADAIDPVGPGRQERVALVVGRAGGTHVEELPGAVERLRSRGDRVEVVYLDAPDDILVRRFEGTRRRHPVGALNVGEAIAGERRRLEGIRDLADLVLDTGELNVNQLRARVMELFGSSQDRGAMQVSVASFGFKHGVPLDADLVFDCRFLPNPYWVDELRPLSGLDAPVAGFVLGSAEAQSFLAMLVDLLEMLLPSYAREGRSYLTVAMGCTGGRHRSVAMAEELARRLTTQDVVPRIFHRDVDR